MIGNAVTDEKGQPLPQYKKLAISSYQPSQEIKELFVRCQNDYQIAWRLQHRPFDEFDGHSLLQRTKLDQQTFGAFVGAQWVPQHKRWRWQGRKNTARNKLIGILAHMLAAMLYPNVHAQNEEDEDDKKTARAMRIVIEEHLRSAGYEMKFLYMVLSALVNPAVIVKIEYLEAIQRIKEQLANGKVKVIEAIDSLLSGLNLRVIPIDQFLVSDFFTSDVQTQPYVVEVNRIPWDTARKIWGQDEDFEYVEAGKTRVFLAGQEHLTLYDIEWTEADKNYVQVVKVLYRDEDLETIWVGGVFMGSKKNVYNTNPFKHRRLSLLGKEWKSIPIYPYAKGIFEPLDPTGRFFYGKSGAFKEYWDDATQNKMHQLLIDGTYIDVFKPMFITGLAKVDSTVIAPAAVIGMPPGGSVNQYSLGPNLAAAMSAMNKQETDMSESTQDKIMQGVPTAGVTATQSIQAQNQARITLGPFSVLIADLIKQVGELTIDCIIQYTTVGELDASIPGTLRMKPKTFLVKTKEGGKDVTNRVIFTDKFMGKKMSPYAVKEYEWKLWREAGGSNSDQVIWQIDPYRFARMKYAMYVDPEQITSAAYGNDRLKKFAWFNVMIHPNVAPFTNPKSVADEMIDEFSVGDADRFKSKANVNDMMQGVMGGEAPQGGTPNTPPVQPVSGGSNQQQLVNSMI